MSQKLIDKLATELEEGMKHAKCKKCGCMYEALNSFEAALAKLKGNFGPDLEERVKAWLSQMEDIANACFGCKYCYGAIATNILHDLLDELQKEVPTKSLEERTKPWPPLPGEYFVFNSDVARPIAVTTLASIELAEVLAAGKPEGLAIVGKTETENIGIEKLIGNMITNHAIRYLIIAGTDPEGHSSGKTLLSLFENGVDENMRVVGSPGRRPLLKNLSPTEVEIFRKSVTPINMLGSQDDKTVIAKISELAKTAAHRVVVHPAPYEQRNPVSIETMTHVIASSEPVRLKLDKAGYFVILPQPERGITVVEHYSYDNELLNTIEGKDARSIYLTIIEKGWVSELSHAAYLGKELEKAALSIKYGYKYVQDGM